MCQIMLTCVRALDTRRRLQSPKRLSCVTKKRKKYGEFNPLSFAAAKFRLKTPSTTALMFASGKIVCTGAPSEDSAHEAIMKYFKMVHSVVPSAVCLDICIENIVGTGFLGFAVDMNKTFEWLKSQVVFKLGFISLLYRLTLRIPQGYVTAMVRGIFFKSSVTHPNSVLNSYTFF